MTYNVLGGTLNLTQLNYPDLGTCLHCTCIYCIL